MTGTNAQVPAGRDEVPARLGALESQIMELLWRGEEFTVRELIARLPTEPAYTTIATVLSNLKKKELVCARKEGHATRYFACVAREELTVRRIEHALESSGDREAAMLHFVGTLTDTDLELLRRFLEQRGGSA
ncbi:MAG TPA: BlaI/MecI/CopY family transcriptional regulator [Rhodoglobus sp.]|nr:BlaI/MecI/CopY family transcriptional regulator [Rhodoglobus sp.]